MPAIWPSSRRPDDPLLVKPGSTLRRDVFKAVTAGFTGITAFGALAVTGAVAGTAAHDKAAKDAAREAQPETPAATAPTVPVRRKHRTVVRTKVVHAVSARGVTRVATGGTLTSSTSASTHSAPVTHSVPVAPPKPAPKPASAPSSGS